jgi:hypothetical protein
MPEWLGLEWVRYAWGPALAGGLIWLSNTWKTTSEARAVQGNRMDVRQEKLFDDHAETIKDLRSELQSERERTVAERARADAERSEKDRWERLCRWWFRKCHQLGHALLSARMGARHVMMKHGERVPETWDEPEELPPLENPWPAGASPAGD